MRNVHILDEKVKSLKYDAAIICPQGINYKESQQQPYSPFLARDKADPFKSIN